MEPNLRPTRSLSHRLALPASGLIALCAFVHACGGGGGGGGGGSPPPPVVPPATNFLSDFQFPANNATNVPLRPLVLIGFNDVVNPATINSTTVSLMQGAAQVASTLTYDTCLNRIQLVPDVALSSMLPYTVVLTGGLLDDDAEALTPLSFSFQTTALADNVRPTFNTPGYSAVPNPGTETIEVLIDWNDATDDTSAAGQIFYRVYRADSSGCYAFNAPALTTGPGVTQAVIAAGINPRTAYSFIVRAVDAAGNESLNADVRSTTTFTSFVQNVFPVVTSLCVSCHNPGGTATQVPYLINMDYSTAATVYNSWVGQTSQCATAAAAGLGTRVVAGDAAMSFLWNKISEPTPACGQRMPFGQAPLSAGNQAIFFDWIEEGAFDN